MADPLWFRVKAGLPGSDGAQILQRRLEVERAWSYAVSTWDWFVEKHPEGELVGPDAGYLIARGAGWQGDTDKFCAAMVAAGYLAQVSEGYRVRGWKEWAGFHLEVRAKEKTKKRGQRGGRPRDVPGTVQGQVVEKAPSGPPRPGDYSHISSLRSSVSVSEGVQGEAKKRWPLTDAVLEALWKLNVDALWPSEEETTDRLERALARWTTDEAVVHLGASLAADPSHPWLGWHLDALKPARKKATHGDLGAELRHWTQRLTPEEKRKAIDELRALKALDPDLEDAPLGITSHPESKAYAAVTSLNEKYRAIAEARP